MILCPLLTHLYTLLIMFPTSLYIHMPWCIKKCPYCDFNSHQAPATIPEEAYIKALIQDLDNDLTIFPARAISSIFIGGGTPSLFSPKSYEMLFQAIIKRLPFAKDIEITLEANPGTAEQSRFQGYRSIGISRLSLGIQSFNPQHLKALGRIHDDKEAHKAIQIARKAGFDNINIDLMHTLPAQTSHQALEDVQQALSYLPEHLSWYQLTIEPNTCFSKMPPSLPDETESALIEENGLLALAQAGFSRYEISAFCRNNLKSQHNMNYWQYGDFYGIGAGAHGKITIEPQKICRIRKKRYPKDYLQNATSPVAATEWLTWEDALFEFMLNASRLEEMIPYALFNTRTGLPFDILEPLLQQAQKKNFLALSSEGFTVTPHGRRFTNDLQSLFLKDFTG